MQAKKQKITRLTFPVVSLGAEYLVMGSLMRRNILTYKAPERNEGYDLICIHPDPKYKPKKGQKAQVRVQVKSRYATDCKRGFLLKEKSLGAFVYLVVVFLNIGRFKERKKRNCGPDIAEFYTLSHDFIKKHHNRHQGWGNVRLNHMQEVIEPFKNDAGFELIARDLGIPKPSRPPKSEI